MVTSITMLGYSSICDLLLNSTTGLQNIPLNISSPTSAKRVPVDRVREKYRRIGAFQRRDSELSRNPCSI